MPTLPIDGDAVVLALVAEDADLVLVPTNFNNENLVTSLVPDQTAGLSLRAEKAYLELTRDPDPAPNGEYAFAWGRRQTWPAPNLVNGLVTNWTEPTSDTYVPWGYIQILIAGQDFTFFRNAPARVESMGWSEPFSDDTCSILIPNVSSMEDLPYRLKGEAPITLRKIDMTGTATVIWEGYKVAEEDYTDENGYGVRLECIGALYDQDRFLARPPLHRAPTYDIGHLIADAFWPENHPGQRIMRMQEISTGINSNKTGTWEPIATGFVQELLAQATTDDGNQWTVHKWPPRIPFMMLKDKTTVHWSIRCGIPGVTHSLTKDYTTAPNIYFGEGVDDNNCRWRNAVYPNLRPDDAPVFSGSIMNPGNSSSDWALFEDELIRRGFALTRDGHYASAEAGEVRRFQASAGISVDGAVGPQTWAAAFEPGLDGGSLDGGFFAPLAFMTAVIPYYHGGTGGGHQITPNPDYDPAYVRREHYINWGAGVTLSEAARSSLDLLLREAPPDYIGTIVLRSDPAEGHRFDIRAGHNILFKNHRGQDRLLHIARAEIDFEEGTMTLEVDEAGRDALTLAEIKQRNVENATPTWKRDRIYRNSRTTEDRIATWDCENGSGVIPRHATYRGLWNVLRIPAAAGGEVVRSEFYLDTAARMAVGIFDRPMTAADLRARGNPLEDIEDGEGNSSSFWDQFGDGLVIAWGGEGQAGGFYPGAESEGGSPTGVLIDDASWYFESTIPPWLWVAIWVESPTVNYVHGRLYPGLL